MLEERRDRSGVPYTLYIDHLGKAHPIYPSLRGDYGLHLDSIRDFNVRSDDIILLGYPKSGNHWFFEILTMLVHQTTTYTEYTLGTSIIDGCPLEKLDAQPSRRVLVSHLPSNYLPKQITDKKTKLVLVLRNPKDIVVSFYDFVKAIQICAPYRGTFNDFFQLSLDGTFAHGRWIDHVKSFDAFLEENPDHPIHIVTYENMKKEPKKEIIRLCHFLGQCDLSEDQIDAIVEKTSFATMSQELNAGKLADMKSVFDKGAPGIFRKGIIGDWKQRLSESQNQEFERHFRESAKCSKLATKLNADYRLTGTSTEERIPE